MVQPYLPPKHSPPIFHFLYFRATCLPTTLGASPIRPTAYPVPCNQTTSKYPNFCLIVISEAEARLEVFSKPRGNLNEVRTKPKLTLFTRHALSCLLFQRNKNMFVFVIFHQNLIWLSFSVRPNFYYPIRGWRIKSVSCFTQASVYGRAIFKKMPFDVYFKEKQVVASQGKPCCMSRRCFFSFFDDKRLLCSQAWFRMSQQVPSCLHEPIRRKRKHPWTWRDI